MQVVSIISSKGGVGKTTTAANLGGFIADAGLRVLLLDLGVQPTLSSYFTLDVRALQFLNSSGINMLYQLVIKARRMGDVRMRVIGSKEVAWQSKSLANMTRFMPGLELVLE